MKLKYIDHSTMGNATNLFDIVILDECMKNLGQNISAFARKSRMDSFFA